MYGVIQESDYQITVKSQYFEPSKEREKSSSYQEFKLSRVKLYRKINDLKGNENCFELAGGLSYRGFKFPGVNFIFVGK